MTTKTRFIIGTVFQLLILGLGIYALFIDKIGLGMALIAATLAVSVVRSNKNRRIQEEERRGLNPYDERASYINGKAAYAACSTFLIVAGLFVLVGSILGPVVLVNPYNTIGIAIAFLVILHTGYYYYYNSKE